MRCIDRTERSRKGVAVDECVVREAEGDGCVLDEAGGENIGNVNSA